MTDATDQPRFDGPALEKAASGGTLDEFLLQAFIAQDGPNWATLVDDAVRLHEQGAINMLELARRWNGPASQYSVTRFFSQTLPRLEAPVDIMVPLLCGFRLGNDQDGVAYEALEAISTWCAVDPQRCEKAYAGVVANHFGRDILNAVLAAGLRADPVRWDKLVIDLLHNGTAEERTIAALVLRFVPYGEDPGRRIAILQALVVTLEAADERLTATAIGAILAIAAESGSDADELALAGLDAGTVGNNAPARAEIASLLAYHRSAFTRPIFEATLVLLADVTEGEPQTLQSLGFALGRALESEREDAALQLIETLLLRGITINGLSNLGYTLLTDRSAALQRLVARWLLDGRPPLCRAVHDIALSVANKPPRFDLNLASLALGPADWAYLIRKAFAHLYVFPETLLSIVISVVRDAPDDCEAPVIEQVIQTVLVNYPGPSRTFIEAALQSLPPIAVRRLTDLLERLTDYEAGLQQIRMLVELGPSAHQRFLAQAQRIEQARAIRKGAREASIFNDLIPTRSFQYGDSVVSTVFGADNSETRHEFRMGQFETRMDIARLGVIDPIGFEFRNLLAIIEARPT